MLWTQSSYPCFRRWKIVFLYSGVIQTKTNAYKCWSFLAPTISENLIDNIDHIFLEKIYKPKSISWLKTMKIITWMKYNTCLLFSLVQWSLLRDTKCLIFLATETITCYHVKLWREKWSDTLLFSKGEISKPSGKQIPSPKPARLLGDKHSFSITLRFLSQDTWSFCWSRNSPANLGVEFGNVSILNCEGANTYKHTHKHGGCPVAKYMEVHIKLTDAESREKALKPRKQLCSGQVSYPPWPTTGVIFTCCWILSPDFLLA